MKNPKFIIFSFEKQISLVGPLVDICLYKRDKGELIFHNIGEKEIIYIKSILAQEGIENSPLIILKPKEENVDILYIYNHMKQMGRQHGYPINFLDSNYYIKEDILFFPVK